MNKLILTILAVLIIIPIAHASISTNIVDAIPLYQNISIDISANTTSCTSKFYANNGSTIYRNESFTFDIPDYIHSTKGIYKAKVNCTDGTVYTKTYFVTKNGELPASDSLSIFIYFLFIVAIIGLMATFLLTLKHFIAMDTNEYDLLASWGFYLLLYLTLFLASTYLINTLIEGISDTLLYAFAASNMVLPAIAFAVRIIIERIESMKGI